MNATNPINLVIVYTAEARKHADYLRDLIAINDDTENAIIGIEDGTVKVITCDDKKFEEKNNTSHQKVVFIGKCKHTESTREHARWKLSEHGLKCGWFGNKAILYIEKDLIKKDDYEAFYEYGMSVAKRLEDTFKKVEDSKAQKVGKYLSTISLLFPYFNYIGASNLLVQAIKRKKEIKAQQYDTMVRAFFLDHMQNFLEGKS